MFSKFVTKPITNGFSNRTLLRSDLDDFFETKKLIQDRADIRLPNSFYKKFSFFRAIN